MVSDGTSWLLVTVFSSFIILAPVAEGVKLFSELQKTLVVSASLNNEDASFSVARAGSDQLHVSWSVNASALTPGAADASYKTVKLQLCFAPVSQVDRAWRKTKDELSKDKTCTFEIASQAYKAAGDGVAWTISKEIPKATYFVRAYAEDGAGEKVAFGQTTDKNKTTNLFTVEPITGRHASMDIAAGVFSAFSVMALLGFFMVEKKLSKTKSQLEP